MSRFSVLVALTITAAIIWSADLATEHYAMNFVPRHLIQTIAAGPKSIDVLGIGNSLIAAGFDPDAIGRMCLEASRPCIALNGGLGSSGVIEHLALTRLALRNHAVKTIVYGFFDQQMASDVAGKNADLIGNRNILYYLEPQLTLDYARFNVLERLSFQVYRRSALLRERGAIWAKIERLRRTLDSAGMPSQESNQFGRKNDFSLLEARDSGGFGAACQAVIRSGEFLSAPVQALLQQAREHGVKVIVVEMPMHPLHVHQFYEQSIWGEFRSKTRLAVERAGATYINASAWIREAELFADHLHLSKNGAAKFSEILAGKWMQQRQ